MKTSSSSMFYNVVLAAALIMIVAVFVGGFVFMAFFGGQMEARLMVLLIAGAVGILALLTGLFYALSRMDTERKEANQFWEDK